ncbi:MAG TPA: protein-disulfide reductase DsbD domain-containing protein [Candidatus Krumholzibacteria bacterium]|nr:protein-disulfide reductase DsbD domain-containing protein [Candidatus Krumholzibacteria bacterium]
MTRRIWPRWFAAAAFASALAIPCETRAQDAGIGTPSFEKEALVQASLVCDASAIAPGGTFRLAVRLAPASGWHVNWLNPGDAGLAPGVKWQLPDGFKAGLVCWPLPDRFRDGPLVIFGYGDELLLVTEVTAPANLEPGTAIALEAGVSWLACNEACVPGAADLSLSLPVATAPQPDAAWTARISAAVARCPQPAGVWSVSARLTDSQTIAMEIQSASMVAGPPADVFFFPYDPGIIENAAPQRLSVLASPSGRAAYQLSVELAHMAAGIPPRLSGILVSSSGWSGNGAAGAIEIDVPLDRR